MKLTLITETYNCTTQGLLHDKYNQVQPEHGQILLVTNICNNLFLFHRIDLLREYKITICAIEF